MAPKQVNGAHPTASTIFSAVSTLISYTPLPPPLQEQNEASNNAQDPINNFSPLLPRLDNMAHQSSIQGLPPVGTNNPHPLLTPSPSQANVVQDPMQAMQENIE